MNSSQTITVGAGGLAGAIVTLLVSALAHFGIQVDGSVSAALMTVAVATLGYVFHRTPHSPTQGPPA